MPSVLSKYKTRPGLWKAPEFSELIATTATFSTNKIYYVPFLTENRSSYDKLAAYGSAAAGRKVKFGLFSSNDWAEPGAFLGQLADIDWSTGSNKESPLFSSLVTFDPALFFIGVLPYGTGALLRFHYVDLGSLTTVKSGVDYNYRAWSQSTTGDAFPATAATYGAGLDYRHSVPTVYLHTALNPEDTP